MADLAEKEFRTVIEDSRARHTAVVGLLYATDAQSISLLRLYATLGIATASGAAAGFGSSALISRPLAWALSAGALGFVIGAGFCLRALRPCNINLPGRTADFWEWGLEPGVDQASVLSAYLRNLKIKGEANLAHNKASANALKWAKRCSVATPICALVAAAAASLFGF